MPLYTFLSVFSSFKKEKERLYGHDLSGLFKQVLIKAMSPNLKANMN
jgi:hypothetical protein